MFTLYTRSYKFTPVRTCLHIVNDLKGRRERKGEHSHPDDVRKTKLPITMFATQQVLFNPELKREMRKKQNYAIKYTQTQF